MSDGNVVSLGGHGTVVVKEPNQIVISLLERMLQEARAGEIVGLACAYHGPDWCAGYSIAGYAGGYSMLGAMQCAVAELSDINRDKG